MGFPGSLPWFATPGKQLHRLRRESENLRELAILIGVAGKQQVDIRRRRMNR
jgi:hypothetical protein